MDGGQVDPQFGKYSSFINELKEEFWEKSIISLTLSTHQPDKSWLKGNYSVKRLNNQSVSEWSNKKIWYTFFKSYNLISVSVFSGWGFL